jgi:hypothetical protein
MSATSHEGPSDVASTIQEMKEEQKQILRRLSFLTPPQPGQKEQNTNSSKDKNETILSRRLIEERSIKVR